MTRRSEISILLSLSLILSLLLPASAGLAADPEPVRVMLDGKLLSLDPPAVERSGRILVPLRGLFEAMGARVGWNADDRSIAIQRGDRYLLLRINRQLGCLNPDCTDAAVMDVPAQLIGESTYVPVRFVAEALGVNVGWDGAVLIDTTKKPEAAQAGPAIPTLTPGQVISEPVTLRAAGVDGTRVLFYLLDPATGSGRIVAAGANPEGSYTFTPDPAVTGTRLIVAAVRDGEAIRFSKPVPVQLEPKPQVTVTGVEKGAAVTGPVTIGSSENFVAARVDFALISEDDSVQSLASTGPNETFTWYPQIAQNGTKWLQAVASDRSGKYYQSKSVRIEVQSGYRESLTGISQGDLLSRPAALGVKTNYPVAAVEWSLDGRVAGQGETYRYDAGMEANGPHRLAVRITAADGTVRSIGPVAFTVGIRPEVWLSGAGPGQVLTGATALRALSSLPLGSVAFYLTDGSGQSSRLGPVSPDGAVTWKPTESQAASCPPVSLAPESSPCRLRAEGIRADGQAFATAEVPVRIYLGEVFGPVAADSVPAFEALVCRDEPAPELQQILTELDAAPAVQALLRQMPQDCQAALNRMAIAVGTETPVVSTADPGAARRTEFLGLAMLLAKLNQRQTGISAALQVAQSVQETGWGQFLPVDKYSGQPSYNLFGLKGTGPAGSVTAGTSELYQGVWYDRVDADFQAYHDLREAWDWQVGYLCAQPWLAPFRAVASDPVLGAWGLQESEYATDPLYAAKLIALLGEVGLPDLDLLSL